jgi:hypothetical protein
MNFLQPPFSVVFARFDSVSHTIVARTLPFHPLDGWRYWRVTEREAGRLTIETGAMDRPYPYPGPAGATIIATTAKAAGHLGESADSNAPGRRARAATFSRRT